MINISIIFIIIFGIVGYTFIYLKLGPEKIIQKAKGGSGKIIKTMKTEPEKIIQQIKGEKDDKDEDDKDEDDSEDELENEKGGIEEPETKVETDGTVTSAGDKFLIEEFEGEMSEVETPE